MSTDYEIVCHKHKERVSICTDGMSGPMLHCDWSLASFCVEHEACDLNIISEHNDEFDGYKEWNKSNHRELLTYGR